MYHEACSNEFIINQLKGKAYPLITLGAHGGAERNIFRETVQKEALGR